MITEEIRSYEVSVWTLLDEFITVLKWSDIEQKGRIENPKMTLNIDGTLNFDFSIPMYYYKHGKLIDNPNWYNTLNGNLLEGLRKIKVIFNKGTNDEAIFEFLIIKMTDGHEKDVATCDIKCEGLAFHELGKQGYKISLSLENFELKYKEWAESGRNEDPPIQSLDYWCNDKTTCNIPLKPADQDDIDPNTWYYEVRMNLRSFKDNKVHGRLTSKIYEEPFPTLWSTQLIPEGYVEYLEKARSVTADKSNLYNLTLSIAEAFGVHCRYEYTHDENYHITSRTIVFYNHFFKEEEGIMSFTYPYSSSKITRETDCTNLTTKLYVLTADNDKTIAGYNTIMNASTNPSHEDYILNFDYMLLRGIISQDQYDAIKPYLKLMRDYNDRLIMLSLNLSTYSILKTELEAKKAVYEKSVELDGENIALNQALKNAIDMKDANPNDGLFEMDELNPDMCIVQQDLAGIYYINLNTTKKGIKTDTVRIFRHYNGASHNFPTNIPDTDPAEPNEITSGFTFAYDEYGRPCKILGITPRTNSTGVYLTYKYDPLLYYDAVVKVWDLKLRNDEVELDNITTELGTIDETTGDGTGLLKTIYDAKEELLELLDKKDLAILEFNHLMGAALREGYWQPEDYKDYGINMFDTKTLSLVDMTGDTKDSFVVGWDDELFDKENKNYYEEGVNLKKVYYPCIDLSEIYSEIANDIMDYSFVFNNNYLLPINNTADIRYTQIFSIGSGALLEFGKKDGVIYPLLVLVGAKSMSNGSLGTFDELSFMLSVTHTEEDESTGETITIQGGNPRICKVESNNDGTYTLTDVTSVNEYFVDGSLYTTVYPRIKFSSLNVRADSSDFIIKYAGNTLEIAKDYTIATRNTLRSVSYLENNETVTKELYFPEYFLTIKPDTIYKNGTYAGSFEVHYVISNADNQIYLDALEVSKENAFPKVEYGVEPNILNKHLSETLYDKLATLVMINDVPLKLDNVFGYISLVELDLDKVTNDKVEVKNYTSKFEDLFSTIVAQTELMKQDSAQFHAAAEGAVVMKEETLLRTLSLGEVIFNAYMDSYFDSSEVVRAKLESLFTEAGEILGDSNKALNLMRALTMSNASILHGFAENVAKELSTKVYRQDDKPTSYKIGDVWIDSNNNRYIATSSSSDVSNSESKDYSTYGFVKTYDGTLAQIRGASMNLNAQDGIIDIEAETELNLKAGEAGSVNIAAGMDVNITGNRSVNIGGTAVNLCSYTEGNTTYTSGITLIAGALTDIDNALISKVIIKPTNIDMASAELTLKAASKINLLASTGSIAGTSAIQIDADEGIWLGSGAGLRIFGGVTGDEFAGTLHSVYAGPTHPGTFKKGDYWILTTQEGGSSTYNSTYLNRLALDGDYTLYFTVVACWKATRDSISTDRAGSSTSGWTTLNLDPRAAARSAAGSDTRGASAEFTKDHLLLGYYNSTTSNGSTIEMTDEYMILATGSVYKNRALSSRTNAMNIKVNGTSSGLIGAKFTRESIGLAVSVGGVTTAMLMDGNGFTVGSGNVDITTANLKDILNGSYTRIASTGIELGSLADLYINTDNFKLLTHSREKGDTNSEFEDGNTIFAVGSSLLSIDKDTAYDPTAGKLRKKTGTNTYTDLSTTPDVKLLLNKNGAYFSGTVYAAAGSFTGSVTATSFTLNDNNAYSIVIYYALNTSHTTIPADNNFSTTKPDATAILTYAAGLSDANKEKIYLWTRITSTIGGKSLHTYSCEHINADGTTNTVLVDYTINSSAAVPDNATWSSTEPTATTANPFLITRTRIFLNYTWTTTYTFSKLIDDDLPYVISIKTLYYLHTTGNAPSKPTTEVTNTNDEQNKWTLTVPTYSGTTSAVLTYYTCEQKKWANHSPELEWTTPVQNYGLTVANQHATAALQDAADAATSVDPIVTFGLDSNVTWNGKTYALALGNNKTEQMLIGSNGGVTIVDTNLSSGLTGYGSSIVLKGGGIALQGSSINFTTVGSNTSALALDNTGITMGTSGIITLLSNNVILDSTATGTNSIFELKKKASDWTEANNHYDTAMKYSITNGLEVTGAITATRFVLSGTTAQTEFQTAIQNSGVSFGVDGIGPMTWNGDNYTVAITSTQNLLIGANGDNSYSGGVVIARDASNKAVEINKNHINFDYSTENYIHMDNSGIDVQGTHIRINGEAIWERGDILWGSEKPTHTGPRSWIWICPDDNAAITYKKATGSGASSGANAGSGTAYCTLEVLGGRNGFSYDNNARYKYTLTFTGHAKRTNNNENYVYRDRVTLELADGTNPAVALGNPKVSCDLGVAESGTSATCPPVTVYATSTSNLTGGNNQVDATNIRLNTTTGYAIAFVIDTATLIVETIGSTGAASACTVYYFPGETT